MKKVIQYTLLAGCIALTVSSSTLAADILSPNDFIISIDTDPFDSNSSYPEQETPSLAGDGLIETKYLNFGKLDTGFIVTPFIGATTIQSMTLATANDEVPRDPASWKIYGTNDAISSVDNGTGDSENWSLIAEGDVTLPDTRDTVHTPISFTNSTAYTSYRVLFPTVKDAPNANSMQIAEVGLFETNDGSGSSVWDDFDFPIAFQLPAPTGIYNGGEDAGQLLDPVAGNGVSQSASPDIEGPTLVSDGTATKYLNFGAANSGFITTPASGPSTVQSFKFFTANDFPTRDPSSYELYGTNDSILSMDHSLGDQESWTLITAGDFSAANANEFPEARDAITPVTSFANSTAYSSYKMVFPTLKDDATACCMQIGEAFFFEDMTGAGFADILGPTDSVLGIDEDQVTGLDSKFLNLGGENGGFIVTPAAGSSTIDSFQISTANDAPNRDPATWELYGTDETINSVDTERGDGENWTLIDSGTFDDLQVPMDRQVTGEVVSVNNTTEYRSYRMVFPTVRDTATEDLLQLSAIQFFGEVVVMPGDFDGDGDVDGTDFLFWQRGDTPNNGGPADLAEWQAAYNGGALAASSSAVPEPSSVVLVVLSAVGLATGTRRRDARGSASRR